MLMLAIILDQWKLLYPGQFTLLGSAESVRQAYSWFTFWQRSLLDGTLPLWDPNAWGGYAFAGEMQTAPFYPLYSLLLLFRPNHFGLFSIPLYNSLFIVAHILAALFMFALLRQLRISRFSAFVGGFAFSSAALSGQSVGRTCCKAQSGCLAFSCFSCARWSRVGFEIW